MAHFLLQSDRAHGRTTLTRTAEYPTFTGGLATHRMTSGPVLITALVVADIRGSDKYSELTSEFSVRGTYCDLANKLDARLATLSAPREIGHRSLRVPTPYRRAIHHADETIAANTIFPGRSHRA